MYFEFVFKLIILLSFKTHTFFSKFDKDLKIYLILMARLFTRKYGDLVFVYLKTLVSVPFKISHKIATHIEELTRNS